MVAQAYDHAYTHIHIHRLLLDRTCAYSLSCSYTHHTPTPSLPHTPSLTLILSHSHLPPHTTAQYLFGPPGKLLMEVSNIGVLFGASIGMFVIIGDVAPATMISLFALEWVSLMTVIFIHLPLTHSPYLSFIAIPLILILSFTTFCLLLPQEACQKTSAICLWVVPSFAAPPPHSFSTFLHLLPGPICSALLHSPCHGCHCGAANVSAAGHSQAKCGSRT